MLIKNSLIFAGTTLVKGVCAFLVIAAFTRLLSPAEYGQYIILFSVMIFVDAFAFQSVRHCVIRHVTSDRRDSDEGYMKSVMQVYAALGAVCISVPVILSAFGLTAFTDNALLFALLGVLILAEALSRLIIDMGRIRNNYDVFVVVNIAKPLLSLAIGAGLIVMGQGVAGAIYGMLIGTVLSIVYGLARSTDVRLPSFRTLDRDVLMGMAAFGLPLVVTFFIQSGMDLSNRFLLQGLIGDEIVGLYSAAQDVPSKLLNLVILGVHIAAYPLAVKALEDGGVEACRKQLEKNFLLLMGVSLPSVVGMVVLTPYMANIFVGEAFRPFMLQYFGVFVVLAFVNAIVQYYLLLAFNLSKTNKKLIMPFLLSFLVMVGVGLLLIPAYQADGAIWAAICGYGVLFVSAFLAGRRVFALPFPVKDTLKILAATAIMAAAVHFIGSYDVAGHNLAFLALAVTIGGLVYAACIAAMDVAEIRSQAIRLWIKTRA